MSKHSPRYHWLSHMHRKQAGQAQVEYIISAIFLFLMVWYGLVGGSVDPVTQRGGLWEASAEIKGKGAYAPDSFIEAPGLIQALEANQKDYRETLYKP